MTENVVAFPFVQQAFGHYVKDAFAAAHELDSAMLRTIMASNDSENGAAAHEKGSVGFLLNA